jgi:hypothetical protein
MFRRSGIRLQAFMPLRDSEGEQFPIPLWTWWKDEMNTAKKTLAGAEGPWLIRSEQYVTLTWTVVDDSQVEVLASFFERTRLRFRLDRFYFDQCNVTFAVARRTRNEPE